MTKRKWNKIKGKKKKRRTTTVQLFFFLCIVCCVYMICRCFFPRHSYLLAHTLTHILMQTIARTHHTSKYRFAVMYLLLRLIVLNLAHKNSNVFAHQKVFSQQHIKRQSTPYTVCVECTFVLSRVVAAAATLLFLSRPLSIQFYVQL